MKNLLKHHGFCKIVFYNHKNLSNKIKIKKIEIFYLKYKKNTIIPKCQS